ncbi:UDP-N-acetylmuramoyl-L-alanine--D-glutamate ligase [Planctomycetota bacterium]
METNFFTGKTVLVMGLGHFGGGVDVARFASQAGANVIVTDLASPKKLANSIEQLTDCNNIQFHLGEHTNKDFQQADIIVVNPAVKPDNKYLKIAADLNKFITSQMNIFFELCPAHIIAITGSNGKSTTAALTTHLLQNTSHGPPATSHESVWLSGNIGNEPLLCSLDKITADDLVVLEVSSFQANQLAQIQKGPEIAMLTNLTPNHLDMHPTFEDYCNAKENLFRFQKTDSNSPAVSIFNAEDKIAIEWFKKYTKDSNRTCIKYRVDDLNEEFRLALPLPGWANLSNLAAAVAIAKYYGVTDDQIASALPEFKPLPHRLELVGQYEGVNWYNDSISTTAQSTIAAIEAFDQPKIIIAGGCDKNTSFDELGKTIAETAKAAILIGQTAPKIAQAIEKHRFRADIVDSLDKAVALAREIAEAGDVVLLSPACASYDMFDNFQDRGDKFQKLVKLHNSQPPQK